MTYRDIFNQILSEVSGRPTEQINDLWEVFLKTHPGNHRLDEELPDEKARQLLEDLRKEKPGILAWLIRGAQEVHRNQGNA